LSDGAPANDGNARYVRRSPIRTTTTSPARLIVWRGADGHDRLLGALQHTANYHAHERRNGINQEVTITGPGANLLTVSGNNVSRIFRVGFGVSVVFISGMTIANGKAGDVGAGS